MQEAVHDVIVVGTGSAGFAAALTASLHGLDVLMVEKDSLIGGTTAYSAGVIWIPANSAGKDKGIGDSVERGLEYIREEAKEFFDEKNARAFVESGAKALDFLQSNTEARFDVLPTVPDYHPYLPGGLEGGRSLRPAVYDGRRLGAWFSKLRPPLASMTIFGGMMVGSGDIPYLYSIKRSLRSMIHAGKMFSRYAWDRLSYPRGTRLTNGNALIARLLRSALDRGIPIWLSSPCTSLVMENGRVCGAEIRRDGQAIRVTARRGVILATGGFPANSAMRHNLDANLHAAGKIHSLAPPANTGDGVQLAKELGGVVNNHVRFHVAWVPVSLVPQPDGDKVGFPHFNDRAKPGFVIVNKNGNRFANEAVPYHDFVPAALADGAQSGTPETYLVGDHISVRRWGIGAVPPSPMPLSGHVKSGYLKVADTIEELARVIGVDLLNFRSTIQTFNDSARQGRDPAFGRGSDAFQRYHGGSHGRGPHPNLAPIESGPFYAIRLVPGDIGTFAGLKTSAIGEVLTADGASIPGLYAVGNDMTSVMGGTYPGAGITIGPALTFGYLAASHLAGSGTGDS